MNTMSTGIARPARVMEPLASKDSRCRPDGRGHRPGPSRPPRAPRRRGLTPAAPARVGPPRRPPLTLPAPRLEQLALGELRGLDARHRLAQLPTDLGEHVGILVVRRRLDDRPRPRGRVGRLEDRSEEHTSELQSHLNLVCRLLLEKKNIKMALAH